jgi:hypothetical protein
MARGDFTIKMDASDLIAKLAAMGKKVLRKGLRSAGGAAAKVMKPAMQAAVPKVTGLLRRSLGPKVKVYVTAKKMAVWAGVGPRAEFRSVFRTERTKKGKKVFKFVAKLREGKLSPELKATGHHIRWPNKYAHLAGPRRKATFVRTVISRTRKAVKEAMAKALRAVIESN